MRQIIIKLIVLFAICIPSISYSFTLVDDFNDGDLQGWTMKQGVWENPGDHMLSSSDNYGIIWKDDSFGYEQSIKIDAYFDDAFSNGGTSKTAQLRLRSGDAGTGPNPFFDHGYMAIVLVNYVEIRNAIAPYTSHTIAWDNSVLLTENTWHTIEFVVTGSGNDTYLELWIDGDLYLAGYDTSGYAHDDGGYVALGSSNHINRRIKYDNFEAVVDAPSTTEINGDLARWRFVIDMRTHNSRSSSIRFNVDGLPMEFSAPERGFVYEGCTIQITVPGAGVDGSDLVIYDTFDWEVTFKGRNLFGLDLFQE